MGEAIPRPRVLPLRDREAIWLVDGAGRTLWRIDPAGRNAQPVLDLAPLERDGWRIVPSVEADAPGLLRVGDGGALELLDVKGCCVWRSPRAVEVPEGLVVRSAAVGERIFLGCADLSETRGGAILEVGRDGSSRIFWRPGLERLLEATRLHRGVDGTLIAVDPHRQVVHELAPQGTPIRRVGQLRQLGPEAHYLRAPADCTGWGHLLAVADTMNHRVALFDARGGLARELRCEEVGGLHLPGSVVALASGDLCIGDAGHHRVILVSPAGRARVLLGPQVPVSPSFCQPRSIEVQGDGAWIVADTNGHRVVRVDPDGGMRTLAGDGRCGDGSRLHWPRAARTLPGGEILVADSGNRRIAFFGRDGGLERELRFVSIGGERLPLLDPHDVRLTRDGFLCTDSDLNAVFELDADGKVHWSYGHRGDARAGELHDPHQAIRTRRGTWIVDSLNDRLICVDRYGECIREIAHLVGPGGTRVRLAYPRALELLAGGGFAVADGNARILLADRHGVLIATLGPVFSWERGTVELLAPVRSIASVPRGGIVVPDHAGGRLLELAPASAEAPGVRS